jgi:hypothetical protein
VVLGEGMSMQLDEEEEMLEGGRASPAAARVPKPLVSPDEWQRHTGSSGVPRVRESVLIAALLGCVVPLVCRPTVSFPFSDRVSDMHVHWQR